MSDERRGSIRPSWNTSAWLIRGPLTDRKIKKYEQQGWYSAEFKKARREKMEKKRIENHVRRVSNFFETDGRLIYSPF
jgi:hypothetical protein